VQQNQVSTKRAFINMNFSQEASKMCQNIYNNAIVGVQLSLKLRDMLITERIISDEDTYDTVNDNLELKTLLLDHLALGASKLHSNSQYGCFGVSDFDLFHNCSTDKRLLSFLNSRQLAFDEKQIEIVKKKRHNFRGFLLRLRTNVIYNFELPETPLKKRGIKTPAIAAREVAEKTVDLAGKTKAKRDLQRDEEGEEKEDISPRVIMKEKLISTLQMLGAEFPTLLNIEDGLYFAVDFITGTLHATWNEDTTAFENIVPFDILIGNHFMRLTMQNSQFA
jgi:hypothetical protein